MNRAALIVLLAALPCLRCNASASRATTVSASRATTADDVTSVPLCVTSGSLRPLGHNAFSVMSPEMRAEAPVAGGRVAELGFTYRGIAPLTQALASGEQRTQIGIKLRARDTCNVIYVMWHIEPTAGIFVSVKSNPGMTRHEQCGARGYANLRSERAAPPLPRIAPNIEHVLRASLEAHGVLRVFADEILAWEGALPDVAEALEGPAGVRSDNGIFDFRLGVAGAHAFACTRGQTP